MSERDVDNVLKTHPTFHMLGLFLCVNKKKIKLLECWDESIYGKRAKVKHSFEEHEAKNTIDH